MSIASGLDRLHRRARANRWLGYFAVFNRIALAAGFLPSGMQKVLGERFTVLSVNHPMGAYLEAFHHTGYYYPFVGAMQVTAAILLLIPVTATLGAVLYFPIILNICILSMAVRFDGSLVTAPLMVLANLFLLCWDYHKLKFIFPFNRRAADAGLPKGEELRGRFPWGFFGGVGLAIGVVITHMLVYEIRPHNSISDCKNQCEESDFPEACLAFCDCIHVEGRPLEECLEEYNQAVSAQN